MLLGWIKVFKKIGKGLFSVHIPFFKVTNTLRKKILWHTSFILQNWILEDIWPINQVLKLKHQKILAFTWWKFWLVKVHLLSFRIRGHSTTTWTEFCHFLTPPPAWTFFYPERGQKQSFFDSLPPSSCPRSYWMPPYSFFCVIYLAL